MLSRAESSSSTQLRRSKSTTSVKERRKNPILPEPLDPETQRYHALVAAHRALDRSHEQSSADIHRSESSASRKSAPYAKSRSIHFDTQHHLNRRRSLPHTRISASMKTSHVPHKYQTAQDSLCIGELQLGDGNETYGAEPSSFRRLRRARSLLTPRRQRTDGPGGLTHTPFSQARTLRPTASAMSLADPGFRVRLKRSLTLLRPSSRITFSSRPHSDMGYHAEAIQLARQQFFSEARGSPAPQSDTTPDGKHKTREKKAFRKTLRTSQLVNAENISSNQHNPAVDGFEKQRRSFSASVRDRVKRAFGKSMTNKNRIPPQHLEATREHFNHILEQPGQTSAFDNYHVDLEDPAIRRSLYIPSSPEGDAYEDLDTISQTIQSTTSRESLHSNARSRVTSWTNSTLTSASQNRFTPLERNRLSIIKEDGGPHQPSSSAGRHIGGVVPYKQSVESEYIVEQPYPVVDSQRIYSALMKRIDQEEAEMNQAQAGLQQIHKTQNSYADVASIPAPTIRAVSNSTSQSSAPVDVYKRQFSMDNVWYPEQPLGMTHEQHKRNVERRRERLLEQESQSSFFPHSSVKSPETPSPFRRILNERRSQGVSDESAVVTEYDGENVSHDQNDNVCKPGQRRLGMSTDSIYSRTTNGGINADYRSPIGSSDELDISDCNFQETGMATIVPIKRPEIVVRYPSAQSQDMGIRTDRAEWKGWIEGQISKLQRTGSKTSNHYREHASIDPEDVDLHSTGKDVDKNRVTGFAKFPKENSTSQSAKSHRLSALELKEVPRNYTPTPKRYIDITKSQSGLLNQIDVNRQTDGLGRNDENQKMSSGLRKITPGNLAKMIKQRKSQILTKTSEIDKENVKFTQSESPPLSTPGHLRLQMKNGNGTGRLRKRASEMAFKMHQDEQKTPSSFKISHSSKTEESDESPTDRVKQSLVARLSRPFNMDVPEYNRPFDSIYLGKKEGRVDSFVRSGRLSVAPQVPKRGSKGYGGLGSSPCESDDPKSKTPQNESSNPDLIPSSNTSTLTSLLGSRRMVSNFLKSRRMGRDSGGNEENLKEETPAFL